MAGVPAAVLLGLAGCSGDQEVLAQPTQRPSRGPGGGRGPGGPEAASATPSAATAGTGGTPVPDAAAMTISFTYAASGGGMVRKPYIAVWVEDAEGAFVRTISLWHLQGGQDRWLSELSTWWQTSGGDDTGSSATRAPGSYDVTWDLANGVGKKVSQGRYFLCIEANREHGSDSLIRQEVTIGAASAEGALTAQGELGAAGYRYTV